MFSVLSCVQVGIVVVPDMSTGSESSEIVRVSDIGNLFAN